MGDTLVNVILCGTFLFGFCLLVLPVLIEFGSMLWDLCLETVDCFPRRDVPVVAAAPVAVSAITVRPQKQPKQRATSFKRIKVKIGRIPARPGAIHLDEDSSSKELYRLLAEAGCSVTRTIGDLTGISDTQQIEYARDRRAILVTHDVGLFENCDKHRHCGVVWAPNGFSDRVLARFLIAMKEGGNVRRTS